MRVNEVAVGSGRGREVRVGTGTAGGAMEEEEESAESSGGGGTNAMRARTVGTTAGTTAVGTGPRCAETGSATGWTPPT